MARRIKEGQRRLTATLDNVAYDKLLLLSAAWRMTLGEAITALVEAEFGRRPDLKSVFESRPAPEMESQYQGTLFEGGAGQSSSGE